jgi:hypothetical protein
VAGRKLRPAVDDTFHRILRPLREAAARVSDAYIKQLLHNQHSSNCRPWRATPGS